MNNKIFIQPKLFHTCFDINNMQVLENLLDTVDETRMSNKDKLSIIMRFHYRWRGLMQDYTVERYAKAINTLKPDINKTYNSRTLLTHLVNYCCNYKDSNMPHYLKLIKYLLSRNDVDVNKPDRKCGFPALQGMFVDRYNAHHIDLKLVNLLISNGAKWNILNKNKQNILHWMLKNGVYEEDSLKYLLFNTDLNVDQKDINGDTPLNMAEQRIIDEEKLYQDQMEKYKNPPNSWYIRSEPTRVCVEDAIKARDMVKIRMIGGI